MISQNELSALLANLESDRIERTISTNDTNKFSKAICAFANDMPDNRVPGYLIIGANDDGTLAGLTITDQNLRTLSDQRDNGKIQPIPAINIKKFSLTGGEVAVVEVLPSDLPPVRYQGQVWIRTGPAKDIATEQQERLLIERRTAKARTWDARPCGESKLSDLALDLFTLTYRPQAIAPEIIEANHRDAKEQLASLRFFDISHDCPSNAGILLFGKDPRRWTSGAYIQFVRFKGEDTASPVISEKELSGDLRTVLQELDSLVEINSTASLKQETALKEKQVWDFPPKALREILLNAVIHRDYESNAPVRFYWFNDRIEIQNPGGLYGHASFKGNTSVQNDYRNPIIAEAVKILGYVNMYGAGVQIAQKALKENGNPEAEFIFPDNKHTAVIIKQRTQ